MVEPTACEEDRKQTPAEAACFQTLFAFSGGGAEGCDAARILDRTIESFAVIENITTGKDVNLAM